jgi:hypothetical protein
MKILLLFRFVPTISIDSWLVYINKNSWQYEKIMETISIDSWLVYINKNSWQ